LKLDEIRITLRSNNDQLLDVYVDVFDNSLSHKWLLALNSVLTNCLHLEKNYCWLGWAEGARTAEYICTQINRSINAINASDLQYRIQDFFSPQLVIQDDLDINHNKMNQLHRYFEDLQGTASAISPYYSQANDETRWHIRQLNLLCHELESLVLSMRKAVQAPEWRRPSQLMCWLTAPRFELTADDYKLFGIETINRKLGGVYVGVNKAVGKHHWEVFQDEGRDSRIGELTTTGLRTQTLAAADFDIEWARDPGAFHWQQKQLAEFRIWLEQNGFDPTDPNLTIGHPQVGQVDLQRSFGTTDWLTIYNQLLTCQDVYQVTTSLASAVYPYRWSDIDYDQQQIQALTHERRQSQ